MNSVRDQSRLTTVISGMIASSPVIKVALIFGLYELCYYAGVLLLCHYCVHFNFDVSHLIQEQMHYPWPRDRDDLPWVAFACWDVGAYLHIATYGYSAGSPTCAYYPLFPAVLCPVIRLFGLRLGFVLSHCLNSGLLLCALIELYRLSSALAGHRVAVWTVMMLLSAPGSIFFYFLYTESLFLLLSLLLFRSLDSRSLVPLVIAAFLLPLCKAIGILLLVPLLWCIIIGHARRPAVWASVSALAGYAVYLSFMAAFTGNAFEGFDAQRFFANEPSIMNIFRIDRFATALTTINGVLDPTGGLLDRILFFIVILSIPFAWRLSPVLAIYSVMIGIVPALTNVFLSYTRFYVVCFPTSLAIVTSLLKPRRKWVLIVGILSSLSLQGYCLVRFLSFEWVG